MIKEPHWQSTENMDIPSHLESWIMHRPSMTALMKRLSNQCFDVNVLSSNWAVPFDGELKALGMRSDEQALVREVELSGNNQVWMIGRSVFPRITMAGREEKFTGLGKKPLGELLFSDPGVKRSQFEVARLSVGQLLFDESVRSLYEKPETIWARRSLFYLSDKPLLLMETFLPTLPAFHLSEV